MAIVQWLSLLGQFDFLSAEAAILEAPYFREHSKVRCAIESMIKDL